MNDIPGILSIYNAAIRNTTAVFQYIEHTLDDRRQWLADKQADGYTVLVADQDGEVVGFGNLGPWRMATAYKYCVENSIYVAELYQGQGIGRSLMRALIEAAYDMEKHAIIAVIEADNIVSISMHESFGFERVAYFKEVGYKFERWLDLVFMEKTLDTPEKPVVG